MEEEMKQVNVQMSADLQAILDEMVIADESDRSKFIRKLIRQEKARRAQTELPLPTQPNSRKATRAASLAA
jgi:metal-responsive CopG/Arc/MetJ family transcriptional regulator